MIETETVTLWRCTECNVERRADNPFPVPAECPYCARDYWHRPPKLLAARLLGDQDAETFVPNSEEPP